MRDRRGRGQGPGPRRPADDREEDATFERAMLELEVAPPRRAAKARRSHGAVHAPGPIGEAERLAADDALFQAAMRGEPIGAGPRDAAAGAADARRLGGANAGQAPPGSSAKALESVHHDDRAFEASDAEFLQAMASLAQGPPPRVRPDGVHGLDTETSAVGGTRRSVRRRIKSGVIEAERSLDLHGLRVAEAERRLARFVATSRRDGARIVKVVTGRGLHSDGPAVVREAVLAWSHRSRGTAVHEVVPAPVVEGGEGAVFLVLRPK